MAACKQTCQQGQACPAQRAGAAQRTSWRSSSLAKGLCQKLLPPLAFFSSSSDTCVGGTAAGFLLSRQHGCAEGAASAAGSEPLKCNGARPGCGVTALTALPPPAAPRPPGRAESPLHMRAGISRRLAASGAAMCNCKPTQRHGRVLHSRACSPHGSAPARPGLRTRLAAAQLDGGAARGVGHVADFVHQVAALVLSRLEHGLRRGAWGRGGEGRKVGTGGARGRVTGGSGRAGADSAMA